MAVTIHENCVKPLIWRYLRTYFPKYEENNFILSSVNHGILEQHSLIFLLNIHTNSSFNIMWQYYFDSLSEIVITKDFQTLDLLMLLKLFLYVYICMCVCIHILPKFQGCLEASMEISSWKFNTEVLSQRVYCQQTQSKARSNFKLCFIINTVLNLNSKKIIYFFIGTLGGSDYLVFQSFKIVDFHFFISPISNGS